jgi:lysophospholipase L1-like esterase
MRSRFNLLHVTVLFVAQLLSAGLLVGAEPIAPPSAAAFKAGDRWCAVGDSITHGGLYHADIYLFHATRFPKQRIELFNCGISGDSAWGALKRIQGDILSNKPTVASIMLGMNDVGRNLYNKGTGGPQVEEQRKRAIDGWATNMRKLAEGLKAAGVRMIFITPSIFDQTVVFPGTNDSGLVGPDAVGVNTGLGEMAKRVVEMAREFDSPVVDFHGPMSKLNAEQQKSDPAFTIVGKDRVHPGPVGHLVMAYLFLKAQGVPQYVSNVVIDAAAGKATETQNGKLENLKATADAVSFTLAANALPFPIDGGARPALKLVPFMEELNQEQLQVSGLKPGAYELLIDDVPVQACSVEELAAGINLAENTKTPQYQQAVKVQQLNQKRASLVSEKVRGVAYIEIGFLAGEKYDPKDLDSIRAILDKKVEKNKGQPWYGYVKGQCDSYLKLKPQEAETLRQVQAVTQEMWEAAVPKAHTYAIRVKK